MAASASGVGFSCALRLPVVEQSHLVLRLRFLLLCPARPAVSSFRRLHAPAGVAVARPAMGPVEHQRSIQGVGLLPLVLLATGRSPIGHPRSLLRMPEPRLLLPELDVRLVILAPLASSWTFGLDGVVVRGSGAVSLR